jgi:hypothetical protein
VSFSGPKNLELGIRGELFYSSLRPKTETAGLENSFSLMPVIGNAVVSVPLGNDFKASVLGGVGFYRNDWTIGTESDDQFYMGYNGGLEATRLRAELKNAEVNFRDTLISSLRRAPGHPRVYLARSSAWRGESTL